MPLQKQMLLQHTKSIPQEFSKDTHYSTRREMRLFYHFVIFSPLCLSLIASVDFLSSILSYRIVSLSLFVSISFVLLLNYRGLLDNFRLGTLTVLLGFFLWYGLPLALNAVNVASFLANPLLSNVSIVDILRSSLVISLFLTSLLITINLPSIDFNVDKFRFTNPITKNSGYGLVVFSSLLLYLISIGLLLFLAGGLSNLIAFASQSRDISKPWDAEISFGTSNSFLGDLSVFALTAVSAILFLVAYRTEQRLLSRLLVLLVAISSFMLVYFSTGTRFLGIIIIAPTLLYFVLNRFHKSRKFPVVSGIFLLLLLYFLFTYQLLYRTERTRDFQFADTLRNGVLLGENDYSIENVFAVSLVPARHDYFQESIILQFLVSPVPRFIWPNKPVSEYGPFYALWRWGVDIRQVGGSVFPGVIGQFYMNWGIWGSIAAGVIFGILAKIIDKVWQTRWAKADMVRFAFAAMFCAWLLVSFRHLAPAYLYPSFIAFLLGAIIKSLSLDNKNRR